jgi:GT2 family glycosyltransferase
MNLSVIISTYNGAKKLPVILNSLLNQTHKDFELLTVVDGSADETMDILKDWENRFSDLKIVYQENKGRAAVRNTGVKNAKNELLLFFDDDLEVDENCIQHHVEYQTETNFKTIFVGEIIDAPIETGDNKEFVTYKKYVANGWHKNMFRKDRKIDEHTFHGDYYLAAANFSITKSIFNKIGGMDETLNRAEDYEFAIRAKAAGIQTILAENFAKVIHLDNNNNFKDWILKARSGEINNAIVYAKDKEKFKVYAPPEKNITNFFKKTVFRSLANKTAYNFMASSSFLKWFIPNFILFRAYDLIVAANSKYYPDNVTL